jgi:hypothetical protein
MSTTIQPTTDPIWVIATNNSDVYIPAVVNVGTEFTTGQPVVEEYITRELLLGRLSELGIEYGEEDYIAEEVVIVPDWDSFNAYMLSDPMFKSYRDTVRSADGDLTGALFDAYEMVDTKGVAAFSLVWGIWVSISGITVADREVIAGVAEGFNLPSEFVAVIRG